jgi:hypothetical protein
MPEMIWQRADVGQNRPFLGIVKKISTRSANGRIRATCGGLLLIGMLVTWLYENYHLTIRPNRAYAVY